MGTSCEVWCVALSMGRGPACSDELWDFTTETEEIVLSSGESQAGRCLQGT